MPRAKVQPIAAGLAIPLDLTKDPYDGLPPDAERPMTHAPSEVCRFVGPHPKTECRILRENAKGIPGEVIAAAAKKPISGGGRPAKYVVADGTKVPGVTTITGRFKESGGLIHWAWQLGVDGKDYRQVRDDAASAGHVAHAMIDASIHGQPLPEPPKDCPAAMLDAARVGFGAFETWRRRVPFELFATEVPLISEVHRFGGTLDALGRVENTLALLDWKSSNGVYPEYLAQIGAYVILAEERLEYGAIQEVHLLRVGKEMGDFHHHSWGRNVLEEACAAFLLMRQLYDRMALLKKVAA